MNTLELICFICDQDDLMTLGLTKAAIKNFKDIFTDRLVDEINKHNANEVKCQTISVVEFIPYEGKQYKLMEFVSVFKKDDIPIGLYNRIKMSHPELIW